MIVQMAGGLLYWIGDRRSGLQGCDEFYETLWHAAASMDFRTHMNSPVFLCWCSRMRSILRVGNGW